jgi:RNA recognition motif-containing protein
VPSFYFKAFTLTSDKFSPSTDDFRLFCGDLGNEVNDDVLTKAFSKYPSFNMARVIRDKWTGKTRGYAFVSFANASDLAAALKEMNGISSCPHSLSPFAWIIVALQI